MIENTCRLAWLGRLVLVVLLLATGSALGKDYSGKYSDDHVMIELAAGAEGYVGTLSVKGQAYPVKARERGESLAGSFAVGNSLPPSTAGS